MKTIKIISNQIEEELKDAKKYIHYAFKFKEEFPELSNLYYQLSGTEREHAAQLHEQSIKIIDKTKVSGVEVPNYMIEMWEEKHKDFIECYAEIKVMNDMYKR